MVTEITINGRPFQLKSYNQEEVDGLTQISVVFDVTSEEYHEVTTLLYKGTFTIEVPQKSLSCQASIQQYSTSMTNLYEKGQVSEYHLTLREVKA
ncbi:DUF3219 family protein [Desertibacillus haloalkaliphilus]|uniref:DUF3219 family protein n=1 Tax=Desertibacillus haloalkaliphilus TaxID=1328930 RepID=UPI001C25AFC9|nr:DUF3219 family protein [Desertibacillus haloalkaliphilus]MBU8905318.1 YkvR family protein [Desertibacillus haloalkaliphilus]